MSIISSASGSVLISSGALGSNYSGSVAYGPKQVSDGLVLYVDAANPLSYSGSGNIWYDLTKNGYNGALSGSAAVVPSWDRTYQGRIHVKASSSYVSQSVANLNTPMSSSFIDFGKILDEVFTGGTNPFIIPSSSGGGTTVSGNNTQFTLNLWFELSYNSQIVQSVASNINPATERIWRSNNPTIPYRGNVPALISKFGDTSTIESPGYQSSGQTGRNVQFRLALFDISQSEPQPPPTSYRYSFSISENPTGTTSAAIKTVQLFNNSGLYRIPNNTPTNICIVFDGSKTASVGPSVDVSLGDNKIKFYVNGYRTRVGDLQTVAPGIVLTNSYTGSNARLALGAEIGATPRQLEGSINGIPNTNARGTAAQIDAKYYMFQVYNKALTPQEVEQNYWAHKYRFIY